jgi:hypothetical protein
MFKRLNQYLLTHHPLLWNTRVVPILAIIALLHGCFFLGGYASMEATYLGHRYYSSLFNEEMVFFSVLCSIAVLVLWLVFYLRNNAFKSFYLLGKCHLAKEFGLIWLIVFVGISFFESYSYGARVKARRITPYATLVQEVNTVNLAMAFIPTDKEDYFILNECKDRQTDGSIYHATTDYSDSAAYYQVDTNFVRVRSALRLPNALSYQHYCNTEVELYDTTRFYRSTAIHQRINNWLQQGRKDSVKACLERLGAICQKYNINYELNLPELAALPFIDPNNRITQLIKTYQYDYSNDKDAIYFFPIGDVTRTLGLLDDCHSPARNDENWERLLAILYVTLGLSLLLWAYRRFSKKVFLIGLIGGVVWCILLGLTAAASRDSASVFILFIVLFLSFTATGLAGLWGRHKTMTGVLLNWHAAMLPVVVLLIAATFIDYYHHAPYLGDYNTELHCRTYPISCWIERNINSIAWANLGFSILYCTFVLNRLAKRWHEMAEE